MKTKWTVLPLLAGAMAGLYMLPAEAQVPRDYVRQHARESTRQGYFPGRQKQGLEQLSDSGNFDALPPSRGGYRAFSYNPAAAAAMVPQPAHGVRSGGQRALLGVTMSENSPGGVQITNVAPSSAAARAGLRSGDHIVGINQEKTNHYQDVIRIVGGSAPGSQMVVHVDRNGQRSDLTATLGAAQ
jgi:S1-C subfamily serine protease